MPWFKILDIFLYFLRLGSCWIWWNSPVLFICNLSYVLFCDGINGKVVFKSNDNFFLSSFTPKGYLSNYSICSCLSIFVLTSLQVTLTRVIFLKPGLGPELTRTDWLADNGDCARQISKKFQFSFISRPSIVIDRTRRVCFK